MISLEFLLQADNEETEESRRKRGQRKLETHHWNACWANAVPDYLCPPEVAYGAKERMMASLWQKTLKLGLFGWRWKWAPQVCGAMSRDVGRQWLAEVLSIDRLEQSGCRRRSYFIDHTWAWKYHADCGPPWRGVIKHEQQGSILARRAESPTTAVVVDVKWISKM
jgi:hypothetical protein